jgi:HTH-type transcriptional regulator, sugar sensing transcriptional regulator
MTPVDMLQQLGLNKYEAEAYFALLANGPLTGYELGKRSPVPLSRSYEILERLMEKGLALVQPGDPPRYVAQDYQQFLAQVRSTMDSTLNALSTSLAAMPTDAPAGEFWVVRKRQNILAQAQSMIASAQSALSIVLPMTAESDVIDGLVQSQQRGCQIFRAPVSAAISLDPDVLLLLRDGSQVLVGALVPIDTCQAVLSSHRALIAAVHGYFASLQSFKQSMPVPAQQQETAWLDWETRKQRRLVTHRVA